ncbi:MAG: Dyp-type peroxidase [Moritella sp.]|uniref:Dyp-type peroxidase n=1 Tax=Moritella sp. TaxID=78556 RepID=UPI0029AFF380|nr:Dyp-type peroxidase [Moritella sp.]MDX2321945.1 Dyp-type peroxidase [Moritella sp.]
MHTTQTGILVDNAKMARYLEFTIDSMSDIKPALQAIASIDITDELVIGIGQSLVEALGKDISGLSTMPAQTGSGIDVPSTPAALWCWLRGSDPGDIFHRSRQIENMLAPGFALSNVIDSFQYDQNRDLSGYEDGTENPEGNKAIQAAIVQDKGAGLDGSSFVAVQQWIHDFDKLDEMTTDEQDDVIGRHISDNEEFDEAPDSAHVKRTAQESFSPEAFILRRSMPWADGMDAGLVFVSFGHSFAAFEVLLNRMLGKEDAISDALFTFTRPISGAYYWCPPIKNGNLDLTVLGF